jgi:hypothetical protein
MRTIICKEVIVSTLTTRGDGKSDPIREVTQVFEKDGELIAENDPYFLPMNFAQKLNDPVFVDNVCLSYRHDFGIISEDEQVKIVCNVKEVIHAILNNISK